MRTPPLPDARDVNVRTFGSPVPEGQQVDYQLELSFETVQKLILQHVVNNAPIKHEKWGGNVSFHVQVDGDKAEIPATVKIWKEPI